MEHFILKFMLLLLIVGLHLFAIIYVTKREIIKSSPARLPIRIAIILSYLIQSVLILNL